MMDLLIVYEDGRRERMQHTVPFTLGRGIECEARVSHWRVARRHLRVTKSQDGYQVEDMGSLYGTRVNGRKFSIHSPVMESDEFIVGPCMIRLFPLISHTEPSLCTSTPLINPELDDAKKKISNLSYRCIS